LQLIILFAFFLFFYSRDELRFFFSFFFFFVFLFSKSFTQIPRLFKQRDAEKYKDTPLKDLITIGGVTGLPVLPWWMSQPYFRTEKRSKTGNESGYLCFLLSIYVHRADVMIFVHRQESGGGEDGEESGEWQG
jgi:hypothetical protein